MLNPPGHLLRLAGVSVSSLPAETWRLCLRCSQDPVEEERGRRLRGHHLLHLLQQHTVPGPRHHRLLLPAQELQPLCVSFQSQCDKLICLCRSRVQNSLESTTFSTLTSSFSSNYILSISASSGLIALLSTGSKWSSSRGRGKGVVWL